MPLSAFEDHFGKNTCLKSLGVGGLGLRCDVGGRGFVGGSFCCCHGGEDGGHVLRL